eukprot:m.381034 g.381034  ORF g.381034 m.381034 type:complete len:630 (-) comp56239_c0_seq2:52-1941(-)
MSSEEPQEPRESEVVAALSEAQAERRARRRRQVSECSHTTQRSSGRPHLTPASAQSTAQSTAQSSAQTPARSPSDSASHSPARSSARSSSSVSDFSTSSPRSPPNEHASLFQKATNSVRSLYVNVIDPVVDVVLDVGAHWLLSGSKKVAPRILLRNGILERMKLATTYDEFTRLALELDSNDGYDVWKLQFASSEYDYMLIRECLHDLHDARKRNNPRKALFLIRTTLHRNIGNIMSDEMYVSAFGTKEIVEQYIDEVAFQIQALASAQIRGLTKHDILHEFLLMRQVYGRSALLLSGGGGLGIYHLGVIKALFEAGMLPRVISGSSAGAIVGSILCSLTDAEIAEFNETNVPPLKSPHFFHRAGQHPTPWQRIARLWKEGTLCDIEVLKECMRENLGDITFQESYDKTNRIMNVSVNSLAKRDCPRVLNYLTAPDVVMWSAVCASCALKHLFDPVQILVKDKQGRLTPWNPTGVLWSDGSIQSDLPSQRLSELFNVNHFIVSQVNPHIVPTLGRSAFVSRVLSATAQELTHQLERLVDFGLLPDSLLDFKNIVSQSYKGHITVLPDLEIQDYKNTLRNPNDDLLLRAARVGQLAAWKQMSRITNHCKIEIALDEIVRSLKANERWTMT